MRSPFRGSLIPVPKGFDDPVKQSCAHTERKWTAVGATLGSGAATADSTAVAGIALPPLAPVLAAGAAFSVLLKVRAQWGKEDPPRADYHLPARLPERRLDPSRLLAPYPLPGRIAYRRVGLVEYFAMIAGLEEAGLRLGATVEAVEKSLGALEGKDKGEDASQHLEERTQEAHTQALLTACVLRATSQASEGVAATIGDWLPPLEGTPVSSLWEALGREQAGQLLAAGVGPELLELELDSELASPPEALPLLIAEGGEAALDLAQQLEIWVGEDEDGGEPASAEDLPLRPSEGPAASGPAIA